VSAAATPTRNYEISLQPFGLVVRSLDSAATSPVGETCYRVFHGRDSACPGCPAESPPAPGQGREVVVPSATAGNDIVWAQRVSARLVRVSARHLDDDLASKIADAQLIERGIRARLTWRERQVMRHVARGCGLLEIARLLGVSRSTAKFHSHNALRKLGAGSRGEVMRVLFLDSGSQS
jgi:DNA-binding CsgD family transcriptional regulator